MDKKKKLVKYFALVYAVILIINSSFFINVPVVYYTSSLLFAIGIFIINGSKKKINVLMFFFYLACIFSIIVNDIQKEFDAINRFISFFFITFLLGPFISSSIFRYFRLKLFLYLSHINIYVCSLSYVFLVSGLHEGRKMNELYGELRPDFAGLYNHSMLLGPFSGFSVLSCIYFFTTTKKKYYLILAFLSFMSLIVSGSRSALLGFILALFYFIYKINKGQLIKFYKTAMILLLILLLSFPFWAIYLESIIGKFSYGQESGSVTASRDDLWIGRINEFIDNPLFGYGFSRIYISDSNLIFNLRGNIEPGSSWLAILSMTGIFGFFSFALLYFKMVHKSLFEGKIYSNIHYLIFSLLISNAMYMIFEGSILSSGTLMFCFLWLVLGLSNEIKLKIE